MTAPMATVQARRTTIVSVMSVGPVTSVTLTVDVTTTVRATPGWACVTSASIGRPVTTASTVGQGPTEMPRPQVKKYMFL